MKCPHCGVEVYLDTEEHCFGECEYGDPVVNIRMGYCPACREPIVFMDYGVFLGYDEGEIQIQTEIGQRLYPVWEKSTLLDESIPKKYQKLYLESEQVNNVSPMASATLSRYLLQMLLHEELNIHKKNLQMEIEELEQNARVPSQLVTMLQVMRRVANFGAHPKKSTNSNEIVEVEKGEAEVMLEVLQQLFDYIFVKPSQQEKFLKDIEEKFGIEV